MRVSGDNFFAITVVVVVIKIISDVFHGFHQADTGPALYSFYKFTVHFHVETSGVTIADIIGEVSDTHIVNFIGYQVAKNFIVHLCIQVERSSPGLKSKVSSGNKMPAFLGF